MKRTIQLIIIGIGALIYLATRIAYAQERTVKDILQHADRARGNLAGIIWDIRITTNEEGAAETRGMTVTVKRKATGKVETYNLTSVVEGDDAERARRIVEGLNQPQENGDVDNAQHGK